MFEMFIFEKKNFLVGWTHFLLILNIFVWAQNTKEERLDVKVKFLGTFVAVPPVRSKYDTIIPSICRLATLLGHSLACG